MAGIIKAGMGVATSSGLDVIPFQFIDVREQAQAQLAAARAQAADMLAATRKEVDAIKAKAEQQGAQAALVKAEQLKQREIKAQLATLKPAIEQAIAALDESRRNWTQHWEANLVHLACRIAEKVIHREVANTPEIALSLIRESLELASAQNELRVELHPDDLATLGDQAREIAQMWNRSATVTFAAHAEIPKGSCRTRTEYGEIDQRFEKQLERIEQELNA